MIHLVGGFGLHERHAQRFGGVVPHPVFADGLLRFGGEVGLEAGKPEGRQYLPGKVQDIQDFVFHLIGTAEDVAVVDGEAADAKQAVKDARALVPVDRADLSDPQRQVAVTARSAGVDLKVEGTVHGLDVVVLVFDLHRREHVLAVKAEVAAGLPEGGFADMGCDHKLVIPLVVDLAPVILYGTANGGAFRMPEDEPRSNALRDAEQVKLASEPRWSRF